MTKQNIIFKGLYTALVTPFIQDMLDMSAFVNLIQRQIGAGVSGIVIAGSTGEGHALSEEEYVTLLTTATTLCKGRIQVIASVGFNNTAKTIRYANIAEEYGADAIMAVTPYYNKPTVEGLFRHYSKLSHGTRLPIMLYSVPSRTNIDLTDDLICRLVEFENIVALKDASGEIEKPLRLTAALGERLALLCGDDCNALAYNANGGVGCVSAVANIIPAQLQEIQDLTLRYNYQQALKLHCHYLTLYEALFVETNPIAIKYALSLQNMCLEDLRLPLCEASLLNKQLIKNVMQQLELLR